MNRKLICAVLPVGLGLLLAGCSAPTAGGTDQAQPSQKDNARLADNSSGNDWAGYGRTYGEQHFSPLNQISAQTVDRLGLAWFMDLPAGNTATIPVEVDGVLYLSYGLGVVRAVDVRTGKQLWEHDTKAGERAGQRLRQGWGIRGVGYWNGKVYTGTPDGRLVALDAKTGTQVWSVQTFDDDGRFITGAPRLFDGKVIIGHGGADSASIRAYVTTYDAETGKQLWRFFIVPGDPAKGFEDKTQEMAAKTWSGEWWKYGGGGTAWNSFTYDAETDTILIGTGNGAPWNQKIRSAGKGDNLFLCSIVALDAKTGAYKWHYQVNPGETWDYNAAMDIQLADLKIAGQMRKVAITAPKNGFLYVIDRTNGKLISASPFAKVTWATRIDIETGRPVEVAAARMPDGKPFELWPSGRGAHSWMPMAFSPQSGLAYIPKLEAGVIYSTGGIDPKKWVRAPGHSSDPGFNVLFDLDNPLQNTSALLAWDPVTQKKAWEVKTLGGFNGGVLATGGNLVFQGQVNGRFSAYSADHGKELWHFDAQNAVLSAPISYSVDGRQYVSVVVGMNTSAGAIANALGGATFDYWTQKRRILTFALDAKASLPAAPPPFRIKPIADPGYKPDASLAAKGAMVVGRRCIQCHGLGLVAAGIAPDLRASAVPQDAEAFRSVVQQGALVANGMPRFDDLSEDELNAARQFIRSQAADLRAGRGPGKLRL